MSERLDGACGFNRHDLALILDARSRTAPAGR